MKSAMGMPHDRPVWKGGTGDFHASALIGATVRNDAGVDVGKIETEVERIRKAPPQTRVVVRVTQAALDRAPRYEPRVAGAGR